MTGFLDRLAAHAQGTAPVLRLRPRSRFEEVRPEPVRAAAAPIWDEFPDETPPAATDDEPAPPPAATNGMPDAVPDSRPTEGPVEARHRPAPADPGKLAPAPGKPTPASRRPVAGPAAAEYTASLGSDEAPEPGRSKPSPVQSRGELVTRATPEAGHPRPATAHPAQRLPAQPVPATARARRRPVEPPPDKQETDQAEPAGVHWPAVTDVGQRLTTALRDAGLLTPAAGREAPAVHWPADTFPGEADLAGRLAADPADTTRTGRDVHLHVHLDRVEVVHPAPPSTRTVRRAEPPAARRPASAVDHDAYLARRREDRR
jgi:hypothetical protein